MEQKAPFYKKHKELLIVIAILLFAIFIGYIRHKPDPEYKMPEDKGIDVSKIPNEPQPMPEDNTPYTYEVRGNNTLQTVLLVTIPSKYNINAIKKICTELRQKTWDSEHLEIKFKVKGDEELKTMAYAMCTYFPNGSDQEKQLTGKDINGIPSDIALNEYYDSDSTIYWRKHPAEARKREREAAAASNE